jgi:hypothetical protein
LTIAEIDERVALLRDNLRELSEQAVAYSSAADEILIFGPKLPSRPAFISAYGTATFVTNTITAVLLFTQFTVLRSGAEFARSQRSYPKISGPRAPRLADASDSCSSRLQ